MRASRIVLLVIILIFTLSACGREETKIMTPPVIKDVKPVQSFGNQRNQVHCPIREFVKERDWIYAIGGPFTSDNQSGGKSIVKFFISNPKNQEVIYKGDLPEQLLVLGDWIFFILSENVGSTDETTSLYKMKKDGSEKTKLETAYFYVLTEKEVYYETLEKGLHCIYAMSLDGGHKRKVLGRGHTLAGIDHGWIYFFKYDDVDDDADENEHKGLNGLYRIKADGTEKEELIDPDLEQTSLFTVDDDQLFFSRLDEKGNRILVKKTIGKDETILSSFSGFPVNKEGNWVYFSYGKSIFKMKANGKGEKELVYRGSLPVVSILLYNGDVLAGYSSRGGVYIKKDGTAMELGIN